MYRWEFDVYRWKFDADAGELHRRSDRYCGRRGGCRGRRRSVDRGHGGGRRGRRRRACRGRWRRGWGGDRLVCGCARAAGRGVRHACRRALGHWCTGSRHWCAQSGSHQPLAWVVVGCSRLSARALPGAVPRRVCCRGLRGAPLMGPRKGGELAVASLAVCAPTDGRVAVQARREGEQARCAYGWQDRGDSSCAGAETR